MDEAINELLEIAELLGQVSARIKQLVNPEPADIHLDWFDQELDRLQEELDATEDPIERADINKQRRKLLERRRIRDGAQPNTDYQMMV